MYIHYVENIGAMLINFLNADFTNYETAYNTFFYAYGYELVKEYVPNSYLKNDKFIDDITFRKIIKDIYDTGSDRFIEWQENFRKCVDKEAKEKINQMKKGKLTENEVHKWVSRK